MRCAVRTAATTAVPDERAQIIFARAVEAAVAHRDAFAQQSIGADDAVLAAAAVVDDEQMIADAIEGIAVEADRAARVGDGAHLLVEDAPAQFLDGLHVAFVGRELQTDAGRGRGYKAEFGHVAPLVRAAIAAPPN